MSHSIRVLEDDFDVMAAATQMFRFNSSAFKMFTKGEMLQHATKYIKAYWTIAEMKYTGPIPSWYSELYIEKHGVWNHSCGRTIAHNDLGMRWAGYKIDNGYDVELADSPDIHGRHEHMEYTEEHDNNRCNLLGDIGQCSWWPAFTNNSFRQGDVWVSVFEWGEYFMVANQNNGIGFTMGRLS